MNRSEVSSRVVRTEYWSVPSTTTTVCCIIFDNGYTEIGVSSCVDDDEYNVERGKEIAYANAIDNAICYLAWEKRNERMNQKTEKGIKEQCVSDIRSAINDFLSDMYLNKPSKKDFDDKQLTIDAIKVWTNLALNRTYKTKIKSVNNPKYGKRLAKRISKLFKCECKAYTDKHLEGINNSIELVPDSTQQIAREIYKKCYDNPGKPYDINFIEDGIEYIDYVDRFPKELIEIAETAGLDCNYDKANDCADFTYWKREN